MRKTIHSAVRWCALATAGLWLVPLLPVGGCGGGGGTTPEPGDPPVISFTPAAQGQHLQLAQSLTFSAAVTPAGSLTVTWRRHGSVVGSARDYVYQAALVGRDTLRAHAEADGSTRDYYWVIDVQAQPGTSPPAVSSAAVAPGPDPVQVVVSWTRVNGSTYPLTDYEIVLSYAGAVTAETWDAAQPLATIPHVPAQVGYSAVFDRDHGGLVAGAEAWFAIRARDDHGQLSATVTSRHTRITTEWWIDGRVLDDFGAPLMGVIVASEAPVRNTNSDVDGLYRLGPYRSVDTVQVQTTAEVEYYEFTTERLGSAVDAHLDLTLMRRYGLDPVCTDYGGDFLAYLRHMTRTVPSESDTAASRLWKWDHYPVSVFLPDSTSTSGRDMDGLVRRMLALWNSTMGETYFVEVPTAAAADVEVAFVTGLEEGYGQASLTDPAGGDFGNVLPVRMRVEIEIGILTDQFFQEVALHEFGHVLGLSAHSTGCEGAGHLMVFGASGNLSLPNPIHPDEVRAVRCVRRLPQGVDMKRYRP
jgi:hypothetical protein